VGVLKCILRLQVSPKGALFSLGILPLLPVQNIEEKTLKSFLEKISNLPETVGVSKF
jgi:hypothetical protein